MLKVILGRFCGICNRTSSNKKIRALYTGPVHYDGNQRKHYEKTMLRDLYERRIAQGPEPDRPRSVWTNWNYDSEIFAFGARLGETLEDETLKRAFTHRSYVDAEEERKQTLEMDQSTVAMEIPDNEEFIERGAEVIDSFIKACLRQEFPALPEDCIRSVTSYLTSEDMLAYISANIGTKHLILTQEFPPSTETLSRTFKAVVGGLLHDQGLSRAHRFVQDFVLTQLIGRDINDLLDIHNPMGVVSAILANQDRGQPEPRLMYQSGAETMVAVYMVGIYSDKQLIGKSYGETVDLAEEMAARDALRTIFGTTIHRNPIKYSQPIEMADTHWKEHLTIDQLLIQGQKRQQVRS